MAITLTESAAARVRRFLSQDGGIGVRIGIRKTGCSGFAYVVELADSIQGGDAIFEDRGVKVVVAPNSLPYLDGTRIDFVKEGLNEGFRYDNPNVKSLCGCGESFGI